MNKNQIKILRGDIIVRHIGGKPFPFDWEITMPLHVELSSGAALKIPVGFITDFATIPRWLWNAILPTGQYSIASIIHDYLYTNKIYVRSFADREFLLWMNYLLPEHKLRNKIMYIYLRIFGKVRFNKYAK